MHYNKIKQNPFLLFLPFLVFYCILVIWFPTNGNFGDESRYVIYAKYMIHGTLPSDNLNFDTLGNGPGYSIILIPFIALGLPLVCITIFNAILYYFSLILLFKTLQRFTTYKKLLLVCVFWAFYLNIYEYMIKVLPETFVSFLITALAFSLTNAFLSPFPKKYLLISGFIIGYLALTKPIFGYVILVILLLVVLLWLLNSKSQSFRRSFIIVAIAMATITPYLTYTYNLTGKMFYLSSFGGTSLYWMTSPHEKEYGSWFPDVSPAATEGKIDANSKKYLVRDYEDYLVRHHQENFEKVNLYTGVNRDEAYKKIAVENMKNYPGKFIINCVSNIGRILFNFPYSYKMQSPHTLIRLPFNGLIVVLLLFTLYPAMRSWKNIYFPIRFLFLFTLVYLGGSILGSAETRMFTVIVPLLLCWITYMFERCFKINLKFK